MRTSVSELRLLVRGIINELREEESRGVVADDFFDSVTRYSPSGELWAPVKTRASFEPGSRFERIAKATSIKTNNDVIITPFDVANTTKKDSVVAGSKHSITLTMDEAIRSELRAWMADRIAERFNGFGVELVVPVESSSTMPRELAVLIAKRLGAAYDDSFVKKIRDPRRMALPTGTTPQEQEIINRDYKTVINKLSRGETVSYTHTLKPSTRKFFDLHDVDPELDERLAKTVLVVDDNIDYGWTLKGIGKMLRSRGIKPLLAAGFKKS
jgi:predicted phosphoribosyltransferase